MESAVLRVSVKFRRVILETCDKERSTHATGTESQHTSLASLYCSIWAYVRRKLPRSNPIPTPISPIIINPAYQPELDLLESASEDLLEAIPQQLVSMQLSTAFNKSDMQTWLHTLV